MQQVDRKATRVRTLLGARVIFANGNSSMDCLIRDLSPTGAKLEISGNVTIPDRFDLLVPQKNQTYRAIIKWRRADEVGVEFEPEFASVPISSNDDLAMRVANLEAEIIEIKRRMADAAPV